MHGIASKLTGFRNPSLAWFSLNECSKPSAAPWPSMPRLYVVHKAMWSARVEAGQFKALNLEQWRRQPTQEGGPRPAFRLRQAQQPHALAPMNAAPSAGPAAPPHPSARQCRDCPMAKRLACPALTWMTNCAATSSGGPNAQRVRIAATVRGHERPRPGPRHAGSARWSVRHNRRRCPR